MCLWGRLTFRWGAFIPSKVCCFWATSCFVNQSITVQSMQSQHLNFCMFTLLLPTACFGHSFDHHQVGNIASDVAFFLFLLAFF